MIYGYARVSTAGQAVDGNSLEAQEIALKAAGAEEIRSDIGTGTKMIRPALTTLTENLQEGDTLLVTKIDRLGRTTTAALQLIDELLNRGIVIHVLNMGRLDQTPMGRVIRTVILAFAELERDLIVERTKEGKRIARQKPGYREGRKPKYSKAQIDHAMELLKEHSYTEVTKMTGISRATLVRYHAAARRND